MATKKKSHERVVVSTDTEAVQAVALNLVHQALDEARAIWLPTRTPP